MSTIEGIHIADGKGGPMRLHAEVRALAGRGLEGEHHFDSKKPGGGRQVTLVEAEAVEAFAREKGVDMKPGDARRNLVTRGVALSKLVGVEFRVGDVRLRGVRLAEPCAHLESMTCKGVMKGLAGRCGLRADILNDGVIRVGDRVWTSER